MSNALISKVLLIIASIVLLVNIFLTSQESGSNYLFIAGIVLLLLGILVGRIKDKNN